MQVLPLIVFQSDWTYMEGAVASTYGVIKSIDSRIEIITASHDLPKFDIYSASYRLKQYMSFWPKGTIFVSVVDPGVGTERKACIAKTKDGYYIVTPDNGTLTHIYNEHGIEEVRMIDEKINRLPSTMGTSVFHGRDLFGYCAAKLASGEISFEEVGPSYPVNEIVCISYESATYEDGKAIGYIEIDDPNFGNSWTNIKTDELLKNGFTYGEVVNIVLKHKDEILYQGKTMFNKTFGDVKKGEVILYNNELMNVSLAIAQGSFLETYNVGFGPEYTIEITKGDKK